MIESIGYTDDGLVWVRLIMEVNKERQSGVLILTPEMARDVSGKLVQASNGAEEKIGVRNSSNTH